MTSHLRPGIPVPAPLRGSESGSFAQNTVVVRLPGIVRRVLDDNRYPGTIEARLQALIAEIPGGPIRPLLDGAAPDRGDWAHFVAPYSGLDWLEVPWFFAETYFYRRILEATGFFQPGPWRGVDPFRSEKRRGLETMGAALQALTNQTGSWLRGPGFSREALASLIESALWGNQADLSHWPAGTDTNRSPAPPQRREEHTLVDDREAVIDRISGLEGREARVDILVDNAGFELVTDLCLVDYLLSAGAAARLVLQLKSHPTFVSDAMIPDILEAVRFLAASEDGETRRLGRRLQGHLDERRLHLQDDYFWTSPLSFWEMPLHMEQELARSDLVISKGDANYRRLLGDRHWPFSTPLAAILSYLPAPLVALRTLKSEVAAGLDPGRLGELDRVDPGWLTNGNWGVIQFVDRRKGPAPPGRSSG